MLLGTCNLHKNFGCNYMYCSLVQILVTGFEKVGEKRGKHFEGPGIVRGLRHRLHGRGFQSKRFHDLETASKTTRFQGVYTELIQPLNPTVYVKAISFSSLCASSIGARFDPTRVRRPKFSQTESRIVFGFSLRYSAGAYRRKSQHFKISLPVSLWYGSRFIVKYTKAAKEKLNHRSKL